MKALLNKIFVPCAFLCVVSTAQAVPVVVDAANAPANGFSFNTTDNTGTPPGTGSLTFVNGPATPPAGIGSINLQTGPGAGDGAVQIRYNGFLGTTLASITNLGYSTYATSIGGSQLPFMTVYVGNTGALGGGPNDRLFFEPVYSTAQGAIALNTWQTWNVLTGNVIGDSFGPVPMSWAAYVAANPLAILINDPNPIFAGTGGIRLSSGNSNPGDNVNTNVDNFIINGFEYNFEVNATPELDPGNLGLPLFLTIGTLLLLSHRKRRLPAVVG